MIGEPRAVDLDLLDVESALLRAAVGDYAAEAAVLLLANSGHWLPQLQTAGLIAIALDGDDTGGPWAAVQWPDLDGAQGIAGGADGRPCSAGGDPRRRVRLGCRAGEGGSGTLRSCRRRLLRRPRSPAP